MIENEKAKRIHELCEKVKDLKINEIEKNLDRLTIAPISRSIEECAVEV